MKSRKQDLVTQKIEFEDDNFRIYVKEHSNEVVEKAYHEEIEIKYHYEESALSIGSEIILAKSGDVTVANPYEVHSNISINQSHGKYCVVILDLDFLSGTNRDGIDLRRILIGNERKICNHIVSNERLGAIIRTIEAEMREKREYYKTVVHSLINEFFAVLIRDYLQESNDEKGAYVGAKQLKLIAPALSRIHLNYAKKFSVEELAEACSISKYHFCRVFKQVMGLTVVQYVTKYRVDVAEVMLLSATDSINEVAYKCGFSDESYFYRCYKRLKGLAPGKVNKK